MRTRSSTLTCPSHSSTLRPWTTAAGVLRGGELEPGARRAVVSAGVTVHLGDRCERGTARKGPSSLRRGLKFQSELLKLSITLLVHRLLTQRRRPSRVALVQSYAPYRLAHTPRYEGKVGSCVMPARPDGRRQRRFRGSGLCVEVTQHLLCRIHGRSTRVTHVPPVCKW
jgi:hypothetical protein